LLRKIQIAKLLSQLAMLHPSLPFQQGLIAIANPTSLSQFS
jgi:hypothetical protein